MNMNAGIHDAAVIATALARGPEHVAGAAVERLVAARDVLHPRTHDTLEEPGARLQRVRALQREPQARREFLRRGAMLDMVSWPGSWPRALILRQHTVSGLWFHRLIRLSSPN
jgi:hypothetical protein